MLETHWELRNKLLFGKKKEVLPTIYTEELCQYCGDKVKRTFYDGDYVYKTLLSCNKCSGTTMIVAVYGEYPPTKQKKMFQQDS